MYKDVNEVRAQLALKFAHDAKKRGLPLFVADAGESLVFSNELRYRGALVSGAPHGATMGSCRRAAMRAAIASVGEGGVVIWSEPEKHSLISNIDRIAGPILDDRADLVVPNRSVEGILSYPPEQAAAEMVGNLAFEYLTGQSLDVWFGPFAANRKALQYFLDYQGEYGDLWDSIIVPRVTAIKAGVRATRVLVDYLHPSEQTEQETGNMDFLLKRIDQLKNLIPALQKEAAKPFRNSS